MTTTIPEAEVLPVVQPADNMPRPPQGQWTYKHYAVLRVGRRIRYARLTA